MDTLVTLGSTVAQFVAIVGWVAIGCHGGLVRHPVDDCDGGSAAYGAGAE